MENSMEAYVADDRALVTLQGHGDFIKIDTLLYHGGKTAFEAALDEHGLWDVAVYEGLTLNEAADLLKREGVEDAAERISAEGPLVLLRAALLELDDAGAMLIARETVGKVMDVCSVGGNLDEPIKEVIDLAFEVVYDDVYASIESQHGIPLNVAAQLVDEHEDFDDASCGHRFDFSNGACLNHHAVDLLDGDERIYAVSPEADLIASLPSRTDRESGGLDVIAERASAAAEQADESPERHGPTEAHGL